MHFGEVIDKSKVWDRKTTYLADNELFMCEDVTENELAIRQINVSKIIDRLLKERLS